MDMHRCCILATGIWFNHMVIDGVIYSYRKRVFIYSVDTE